MVRILIICIFMLLTSALAYGETTNPICKDNPDGMVKDYYTNGRLRAEWECRNGQLNGITRFYYESGVIQAETNYVDGKAVGISRTYYEDGNIRADANYKDDKLDGIAREYYDSGEVKYVDTYKDGEHIDRKEYDKEGELKFDQDYSYAAGKQETVLYKNS